MKKISVIYTAFLLLTLCCTDQTELDKPLDFDFFTIMTPSNWEKFDTQGYDSKTGGITNGQDSLYYDYGWYSDDLKGYTTDTHIITITTIDDYDALIIEPLKKGKGIIGVSIQLDKLNRFTMTGTCEGNSIVRRIFNSIQFK